jgi:ADP-ribose pyrophosphatase YjhB (NUDIX family)
MPKFIFPDGSSVQIPEGVDPAVANRNIIKQFAGKHGLPADAGEKAGWTGDLKSAGLSGLSAVFAGLPGAIRAGIGGDWNNPQLQKYRYQTEVLAPSFERASTQKMREEAGKAIEKAEKEGGISSGALEAIKQFGGSRLGVLSAVQSLPGMLAGAGIGGLAGRGVAAAVPSLAGRKAAIGVAGAVGAESGMEGAEAANETYKAVYEEAIKKGLTPEEANRIADAAAKKSAAASAGVTAILGALPIPTAEKLLAGRLAGRVPGGRLSTAGLGALGEIPTEMAQAATSSIGTQRGLQELIPEEERTTEQLLKGVGGAMGQAAVGAGMIGGGAGFLSGGRRPEAPPPLAPAAEAPPAVETPPPAPPPVPPSAGPAVPPPPAVVMTKEEKQAQKAAYQAQITQLAAGLPPEQVAQLKSEIGGKLNHPTPTVTSLESVGEILKKYQPQGETDAGTPAAIGGGSRVGAGVAGVPTGGAPSGEVGSSAPGALGRTNVPSEQPVGREGAVEPPLAPEVIEGESPFPEINQTQLDRLLSIFNQPEGERVSNLDNYTFTAQKPGGSNPGAVYADRNGEEWLVKGNLQYQLGKVTPEQSDDRANNEVLAAKLISLAGAGAPEMKAIDLKGKHAGGLGVASKMQTDLTNFDPNDSKHVEAAQKDFAIHAWLANYDVLGMGYDNTLIDKQGLAVNIDPGGALLFRAQGLPKAGMLDPTAPEFESMRNTTSEQKAVFGKISPEMLKESAQRLKNIDDSDISDLVDQYGPKDPAKKAELKKVLSARRDAILTKAGALAPTKTEKAASVHPARDENGKKVLIKEPTQPSDKSTWYDPQSVAVFTPGSATPNALNARVFYSSVLSKDIKNFGAIETFSDIKGADEYYSDGYAQLVDFLTVAEEENLKPASGAVIVEPDGRVWVVSPTNGFGAKNTFAKGGLEAGLTPQENAIKEIFEETGLEVRIVDALGNFKGDTSVTRMYVAIRVGGTPSAMGWESQAVSLAPVDKAKAMLDKARDKEILDAFKNKYPQDSLPALFTKKKLPPSEMMPEDEMGVIKTGIAEVLDYGYENVEATMPPKTSAEDKARAIEKVKAAASAADKAAAEAKAKALLDEIDALTKGKPVIADELKALRKQITAAIEAGDADKFAELGAKYSKLFNEVLGVDINPNLTNASVAFPTSTLLENVILFDKDIGKVVDILKGAKSKFLNWIGTKAGSIPDLKIVNDQDLIKKNTAKGKVTNALYKPSDKSLHFNFVTFSGQSGIVGHELLHAIAQKSISYPNASQKPVVKSLKNLYEAVKDHPALQGEYGVKNLQEFVAEGFSNPEFQLVLSLIPYEGQSVWGKFTQLIANLIGVASNQRNAFIELVALTEQLTDLQATQAPKGQVTNKNLESKPSGKVIPPEQAKKNLQKWFGKTTHPYLADKDGNPKILYHGSTKEFTQFKPSGNWGGGVFTSESFKFALGFVGVKGVTPQGIKPGPSDKAHVNVSFANLYPVYVKAENPWDYENPEHVEAVLDKVIELRKAAKDEPWTEIQKKIKRDELKAGHWTNVEDDTVQKAIKALGHDACFMNEYGRGGLTKNIQVYDLTQIKSVFNSGVYNPKDKNILKHEEDVDRVLKSESAAPAPVPPQAPAPKPKKPPTAKQQAFYAKKAAEKAEKKAAKEADAQRKAANLVVPEKKWIDDIRRKFQNVQIGLYNLSDAVKEKLGGVLPAWLDLASALSLSKGEQAANFENYAGKLERRYVVAVKDFMKATNLKVGEATRQLSNYLLAKHELERRAAVYYEKRATLTDENDASRTFLRSAIVANDKELAKLKKDFKADIKTPEQQRVYDLVENSQDRAKDLYQEIINIVNNDPIAKNLDFNATTYDVVAYEGANGEELKMTPEARDQIIADMEAKFSDDKVRAAVEEAVKVQQGLDKAIQTMNKAGDYTPKGAARLMEARGWQNYVPQRGKQEEDSDFEYYGESGGSGLTQSESALGGRGSLADNVITRSISEAKKAAGRAPGNRIATIIHNYVAEGYIKGKISKTPLTTLDNYVLGKNANRGDDIVLYRDPEGDIYEVKIDDPNIAAAIQAKTHDLIPIAEPFATATTLMAQTNTRFNPMFWLKNFFVDPLTNTFIIASEQGFTAARQYAGRVISDLWDNKGTTKAMNFMRLYAKGELEQIGELAAKDAWYRDALEFVNIGGKVSYLSGLRNETQMDEMYKKLGPGKVVRTVEQLAAFVDPMTEGLELALRVSAFRTAKTFPEFQGDARKAAAYSKDLANFEQIGQWGKWMGAWFMFSRPSATGASRLYDALSKGKYAKQTVLTSAAFGSSVFFLSMLMGGDDDEGRNRAEHDDPARWVRNWRLFIPGYESPVQIPWGFGFGSVGAASAQLSMFLFGKSDAKEFAGNMKTIAAETAGLPVSQMSFIDNPFAFMLDSITPTVAKPLLQMVADVDSLGRPVFHKGQSKYVSAYMGGENIPESVKYISETMFDTFKEVLPQSALKGLSADGLHFIANSYLGGVYRTINQMDSSLRATGIFTENEQKDINVVKATLLLSGFVGTAANYDYRQFSEVKGEIDQYKKVLRTYKDRDPDKYAEYKEEHPGRERAVKYFENQENSALRDLREQANKLKLRYKDSPKEREEVLKENRERQNDVMRRMVERTRDLLEE